MTAKPFDDSNLKESRLISVLDALMDANEPLTIHQIQRRVSERWNMDASREEIEALLRWGANQPGMYNAPVKPKSERHSDKWGVVPKHPHSWDEEAAGPIPFQRVLTHQHNFERIGSRGNPYEGGSIYRVCECGTVQTASEDGTYTLNKWDSQHVIEMLNDPESRERERQEFLKDMNSQL